MFLVESLCPQNGQEVVYYKHVNKRNHKHWIVLKSYLFIPNSKIIVEKGIRTRNIFIHILSDKKDSSAIKYESTVWTGFEHGRLKQNTITFQLNDYPTSLLNIYYENKRTDDIENNLINSEFIFRK